MREWKFRAWDPEEKKMYSPEDLEEPDTEEETPKTIYGKISHGVVHAEDMKVNPPRKLVLMQAVNWSDKFQKELFEGDIITADEGSREFLIVWDDVSGSFILREHDGTFLPGGVYIQDVITLTGNYYQNGFEGVDFEPREIVYRAWDPEAKKMYNPEDLKDPEEDMNFSVYGYLSFGALYIYDFVLDPPMELIPMQKLSWKDLNGKPVYEGDIMEINGEYGQICWSDEVGGFMFMSNDGSLYPGDEAIAAQVELIGNIYENEDIVPELKW